MPVHSFYVIAETVSHLDCNILARCMEPVHSLCVACKIPALLYCVVICSGYLCLSGVGYLCCQYPQGEKLFFKNKNFLLLLWHAVMCLFIHSL